MREGEKLKLTVVRSHVPPHLTKAFLEHSVSYLARTGQLVRLDSNQNCPDFLRGKVLVAVVGSDSGKGFTRVGLRLANRRNSNSGEKTFNLCLLNMSDKSFSLHQTQYLLGPCLSSLPDITSLSLSGEFGVWRLYVIFSTDFEAVSSMTGNLAAQLKVFRLAYA